MKVSNRCSIIALVCPSCYAEEIVTLEENAMYSGNLILCRLAKCCDASMFALAAKYHIEPHDVVLVLHVSRTVFGIFL